MSEKLANVIAIWLLEIEGCHGQKISTAPTLIKEENTASSNIANRFSPKQ
jgi:hypothetical protein